jgi:hypothetical protein
VLTRKTLLTQLEPVVLAQDQHRLQQFYSMHHLPLQQTLSLELVIHLLAGQMAQQYMKQVRGTQPLA